MKSLLLPLVLLTSGVGLLAVGGLGSAWAPLAGGALLSTVGAALAAWNALDWRNDYYVITDRRVVWLEKVIGLYDSRQESPLRMILSVETESGLLGANSSGSATSRCEATPARSRSAEFPGPRPWPA